MNLPDVDALLLTIVAQIIYRKIKYFYL